MKERRASRRFPLSMILRYERAASGDLGAAGHSSTIDMSATGLLFGVDEQVPLSVGDHVRVAIQWPAHPLHTGRLLCLTGIVRRVEGDRAAVQFGQYTFGWANRVRQQ